MNTKKLIVIAAAAVFALASCDKELSRKEAEVALDNLDTIAAKANVTAVEILAHSETKGVKSTVTYNVIKGEYVYYHLADETVFVEKSGDSVTVISTKEGKGTFAASELAAAMDKAWEINYAHVAKYGSYMANFLRDFDFVEGKDTVLAGKTDLIQRGNAGSIMEGEKYIDKGNGNFYCEMNARYSWYGGDLTDEHMTYTWEKGLLTNMTNLEHGTSEDCSTKVTKVAASTVVAPATTLELAKAIDIVSHDHLNH